MNGVGRIESMTEPVRCRCGSVYDLGLVEVVARYLDCSVWRTPCCEQLADDRQPGWGPPRPWYTPVDKEKERLRVALKSQVYGGLRPW